MTNKERNKIRKLQDALLAKGAMQRYIDEWGADYPLFGAGSPTAHDMQCYIYPKYAERIERVLREMQ